MKNNSLLQAVATVAGQEGLWSQIWLLCSNSEMKLRPGHRETLGRERWHHSRPSAEPHGQAHQCAPGYLLTWPLRMSEV